MRVAGGGEVGTLRLSEKRRPSCKDGMSSLVEAASRVWDETEDGDIAAASMTEAAGTGTNPLQTNRVGELGTSRLDSPLASTPKPSSADQNLQERQEQQQRKIGGF